MNKHLFLRAGLATLILLQASPSAQGQLKLTPQTKVEFATAVKGRAVLGQRDDFVRRLSPFDRVARAQTDQSVSEAAYLELVRSNVVEWSAGEQDKIAPVISALSAKLAAFSLDFPATIDLVRTTGREEGGEAYTRSNAVVLPTALLAQNATGLEKLLAHELFHILSRHDQALREKLYAIIGFHKCSELEFPPSLAGRKITNPDAPICDYFIPLRVEQSTVWAIPVLFSSTANYDPGRHASFLTYLNFRLLEVKGPEDLIQPVFDGDHAPVLLEPDKVSGFYENVGRNTGYIIHPDEILADNFVLLVNQAKNVRSPEILDKMRAVLAKKESRAAP